MSETEKTGERCVLCGCPLGSDPLYDGRPMLFREDGTAQCGVLSDCYQRPKIKLAVSNHRPPPSSTEGKRE